MHAPSFRWIEQIHLHVQCVCSQQQLSKVTFSQFQSKVTFFIAMWWLTTYLTRNFPNTQTCSSYKSAEFLLFDVIWSQYEATNWGYYISWICSKHASSLSNQLSIRPIDGWDPVVISYCPSRARCLKFEHFADTLTAPSGHKCRAAVPKATKLTMHWQKRKPYWPSVLQHVRHNTTTQTCTHTSWAFAFSPRRSGKFDGGSSYRHASIIYGYICNVLHYFFFKSWAGG